MQHSRSVTTRSKLSNTHRSATALKPRLVCILKVPLSSETALVRGDADTEPLGMGFGWWLQILWVLRVLGGVWANSSTSCEQSVGFRFRELFVLVIFLELLSSSFYQQWRVVLDKKDFAIREGEELGTSTQIPRPDVSLQNTAIYVDDQCQSSRHQWS